MTSFKYVVDSIEQDMESPVYLVTTNTLPDLVSGNTYALFSRSTMPVLYGFFANGSDVSNIDKENMIVIMPNTGIIVRHPTFTDDTGEHLFVSREDGDFGRIHLVFTEGASSSGASGGEGAGGASNSIGTNDLEDGAVTNSKLADDSVSNGKIADGAIDTDQLADDSVTRAKVDWSTNSVQLTVSSNFLDVWYNTSLLVPTDGEMFYIAVEVGTDVEGAPIPLSVRRFGFLVHGSQGNTPDDDETIGGILYDGSSDYRAIKFGMNTSGELLFAASTAALYGIHLIS